MITVFIIWCCLRLASLCDREAEMEYMSYEKRMGEEGERPPEA